MQISSFIKLYHVRYTSAKKVEKIFAWRLFYAIVFSFGFSGFGGKWGIVVPMFFSTNGIIAACSPNAAAQE